MTIKKAKKTRRLQMTQATLVMFLIFIFVFLLPNYIYLCIAGAFLLAPLAVFCAVKFINPIVTVQKEMIYKKAQKISTQSPIIKIWITWSYGKSSVKEYLAALLWVESVVLKTPENINTEIGVSEFVIKKLPDSRAKYFICEMWAYRIWEIQKLWEIVGHKHGFLTAVGTQHIWLFGSEQAIQKWKSEIALSVQDKTGRLYVNIDNENMQGVITTYLHDMNAIRYWVKNKGDALSKVTKISEEGSDFVFSYKGKEYTLQTNLIGSHHVSNLCWVLAFCYDEWIDISSLQKALMSLPLPAHTLKVVKEGSITLIDDSYNLSVESLKAWVEVLLSFPGEKILVLDDVLELGSIAEKTHEELWEFVWVEMKLYDVLYVWNNYREAFIKWLKKSGFETAQLLKGLPAWDGAMTILFEWRWTQKYLSKYL